MKCLKIKVMIYVLTFFALFSYFILTLGFNDVCRERQDQNLLEEIQSRKVLYQLIISLDHNKTRFQTGFMTAIRLFQFRAVFLNRCALSYFQVCRQFVCLYFYFSFRRKEGIWVAKKWFYVIFLKNFLVSVCRQIFSIFKCTVS